MVMDISMGFASCRSIRHMETETRNFVRVTSKPVKAHWLPDVHEIFVDLCLKELSEENLIGSRFTKQGWRNIKDTFFRKTGLNYDKKQLKNHWDTTRKQWKVWRRLISTSRMKWDPDNQTFGATKEDWTEYIQKNPEAAQFRHKELPLAGKLNILFDEGAVSGETEPPTQRRKHNDGSTSLFLNTPEAEPARSYGKGEYFCDPVESRSAVTIVSSTPKRTYSIEECIECLNSMEEVQEGCELYLFALDMFLKKEYREIFLNLRKSSVRIAWLQRLQSAGPPLPLH